jgi:anaerobic magnesium-protoporphyrin IX monomethyl ester cyclase
MRITLFNLSPLLSSDGSRLIAALLKRAQHKVTTIYVARLEPLLCSTDELECLDEILKQSELIMIGVYSTYAARAAQITEFIHSRYPGLKVIWGGPHCISAPELSSRYADGVCFSEGDNAVVELVRRMEQGTDYLNSPNMAFSINGVVSLNKVLPPFSDLNSLPYYDYEFDGQFLLNKSLLPLTKERFKQRIALYPYNKPTLYVLTSRGCPNNCSYCNNCRYTTLFNHNPIRIQRVDRIMNELEWTLNRLEFIEMLGFGDDDFFVRSVEELEEFAEEYKSRIGLPFGIAVSANSLQKRKVEILIGAGLKIMQMGVQSGSERILKDIYNRKIKLSKTIEAVQLATIYHDKYDLDLLLDFIIDNPYETTDDVIKTYKYITNLPPSVMLNVFLLSFFPGTPIYEKALADGIIEPFTYESFRRFSRSSIRYQRNYETFLITLIRYMSSKSKRNKIQNAFMHVIGSKPARMLASLLPDSLYATLGDSLQMKAHSKMKAAIKSFP